MKKVVERLREWLTKNKIFFETAAATLLSIMAIVFSFAQYYTTSKQTELLALQTKITESNALPQFEFKFDQKANDSVSRYRDDILIIKNKGGPIYSFAVEAISFISIDVIAKDKLNNSHTEIPILEYYDKSVTTHALTGTLVTLINLRNKDRISKLSTKLSSCLKNNNTKHVSIKEKTVIHLYYLDILNRSHQEYYMADQPYGAFRINNSLGHSIFILWKHDKPKNISDLNAKDLLDRAPQKQTKNKQS